VAAGESGERSHAPLSIIQASARGIHAPTSEIHSQASVGHASVRGGQFGMWLAAERSGGSPEHSSVALVVVEFLKVDRSDFEKFKSKISRKRPDPRTGMTDEGCNRTFRGGGKADGPIELRQVAKGDR
jgi:hypothetical protein